MKKLYIILPLIFLTSIAFASVDENVVTLKYNKPVNGLKVEAIWKPVELRNGYAVGPAIIQLVNEKTGSRSTIVNNNFGILNDRLGIEWEKDEGGKIKSIASKIINLDYRNPEIAEGKHKFGTSEEPFFFYDVNFDGKKDLVVAEPFMGQRNRDRFKVYTFDSLGSLEDELYQITYREPYILLDSATTIDKENKTITINISSGAADSEDRVYALRHDSIEGGNVFVLKEVVGYAPIHGVLEEANNKFTYQGKPIHPKLVEEFSVWLSDKRNPITVSVDVKEAFNINEYYEEVIKQENGLIRYNREEGVYFAYEWLGKLDNGLNVLRIFDAGGGSGIFQSLFFIKFDLGEGYTDEGEKYQRLLMSIVRSYTLGDRSSAQVELKGDKVVVKNDSGEEIIEFKE